MRYTVMVCIVLSLACVARGQDITQATEANTVHLPNSNVAIRRLPDGEVWETFGRGDDLVGVRLLKRAPSSGEHFNTDMVANLPESDVVGAPQSEMVRIEGDCQGQVYQIFSFLFYSGKNRAGQATDSQDVPLEDLVYRRVMPGTPMKIVFDMVCDKP